MAISFNGKIERPPQRAKFTQANGAEFGIAQAEIAETEGNVRAIGIDLA